MTLLWLALWVSTGSATGGGVTATADYVVQLPADDVVVRLPADDVSVLLPVDDGDVIV